MLKAFLSHSSKQKHYVEIVAKHLGKTNIIFDEWTFEEGNKTFDEIFDGLSETGVFIYFISNEALDSPWVKTEIENAYNLIKSGNIKRLYPIIIDSKIKYNDSRIPLWIQENYNLKFVSRPTKAAQRIRQLLKIFSWELYPQKKQLSQLFIGRTALIRIYEERIFDFEKPSPIAIFSTGLPSIGRRKFITHCLKKSNKIRDYYEPPIIFLGGRDSIEDFILYIYDLGFSQKSKEDLLQLLTSKIEDKIKIAVDLLMEIERHESALLIIDNYAICGQDSYLVDWFIDIIKKLSDNNVDRPFLCLISQKRIRYSQLKNNDFIFTIEVPELEKYERKALFQALLDIEDMQINMENKNIICSLFNGFPEQIFFTFNTIKSEGLKYLIDNTYLIPDYNSEIVAYILQKYEEDKFAIQVLGFLSTSEVFSFEFLEKIFFDKPEQMIAAIEDFKNDSIIEFIGATKECFRLNDVIKDYIQRLNINLEDKYKQALNDHVKHNFKNYETVDRDISDYVITVKEALKKGYDIPEKFLIPSHYLNAMRDLYNNEGRYKYVITLADRVLINEEFLDKRIVREVIYWLCLSLARMRDRRMLKEVQKIDGPDHDFLLGFFYRLTGRLEDALERLQKVLKNSPKFYRAKRELVEVYLNIEEFDLALDLAKENYENNKNNPYSIQSYFRCLTKTLKISLNERKNELEILLKNLEINPHEKAKEMYYTSKAQFQMFIEGDKTKALDTIEDAIATFPHSIYPYLSKIEICRKSHDWPELENSLKKIEDKFKSDSDIFHKLSYLLSKAIIFTKNGQLPKSQNILEEKIKTRFTKKVYDKIKEELEGITSD